LSLRELARRTDVTASFLSQVERGTSNLSLDSLRRIAEALEVSLMQFLEEPSPPDITELSAHLDPVPCEGEDRITEYSPVVRAGCRPRLILPPSGVEYELLVPDLSLRLEAFMGRLAPGTGNVARRLREPTEEFVYILSGDLIVGLDGREYLLHAGDSICFKGETLTKMACGSGDRDAVWISVITPPVF
jgi:hypothetical protein